MSIIVGKFIKASEEYNTFEKSVPAPYIRKSFVCDSETSGKITIACCGFYELFVNGKKYTKGFLAPYISNTDDFVYCDEYEVQLDKGENVIAFILGNGLQNNPGGHIWDFDKASFRSAPAVAVSVVSQNGQTLMSDTTFKVHASPIVSDDYRFGENYDATCEISGWNEKGFDDSAWENAIEAKEPKGELKLCTASPIVKEREIKPVSITKTSDGYIYDFGEVNSGVCRLKINAHHGQKIELQHVDSLLENGEISLENIWFVREFWERDRHIVHKDTYVCKGEGEEEYTPTFTYHGFRYVLVKGLEDTQATEDLLTYVILHSDIKSRGNFECSDKTVNLLQEMTRRSDISNFHYFPTDCPHREKNGWTADAALSCEQMLLNFSPEKEYIEWLYNICKAQNNKGALPGIVPTAGWGFEWGNGPAWDCALVYLPYFTYVYRGQCDMIKIAMPSIIKYLNYLITRRDEKGLLHIGLGDWCHVSRPSPKAPLEVTDSIISMDIAAKSAILFDAIGEKGNADFARKFAKEMRDAIRENLVDFDTMTVSGSCQSCQAMGIFYNVFEESEKEKAFLRLLDFIKEADNHMDVGVLGGRVIFHVLSRFGYSDLAFEMITSPTYPSYYNWIERGATTLWENFEPESVNSTNHHFWGDISGWFIKCLAGIKINPSIADISCVEISPSFVEKLDSASAYHDSVFGRISSKWERVDGKIILDVEIPEKMTATSKLENGFAFENGESERTLVTGKYTIICK